MFQLIQVFQLFHSVFRVLDDAANLDVLSLDYNDINLIYENWFACTIRPRDKPWMNNCIRQAIRKRNRLLKIYTEKRTRVSWERYKQHRNATTTLIHSNKMNYFLKLNDRLQDSSISSKSWWGIVKSLYGAIMQMSIPTLIEGARYICCPEEKAQNFLMIIFALKAPSMTVMYLSISYFVFSNYYYFVKYLCV